MEARLKEKKQIAENTLWLKFDLLGKEFPFLPGQYFYLNLINPPFTDNRGNERHFSIVSSPSQKGIIEMATRQGPSAFKKSLIQMETGTKVEIEGPAGDFLLPEETDKPLVFLAGGIGIAPFMSILRTINNQNLNHRVTLIFSNATEESTAFLEELKQMNNENPNFKLILTMTDDEKWPREKRRIDENFLKDYLGDSLNQNIYFIAGPALMVKAMVETLTRLGIKRQNIRAEDFSGY